MYAMGTGVPENDAEAFKWFLKAAEQGHTMAQYNLGWIYTNGKGDVPVNNVRAYMWWSLTFAQNSLDSIKEKMTPAQIAKAQALASEMWKKINN